MDSQQPELAVYRPYQAAEVTIMAQLIDGGPSAFIQGSGAKPYELKNIGGVFSCSCPAWKNQSVVINRRTCKHLKGYLGAASEAARTGGSPAPAARPAPARASTTASQGNATTATPAGAWASAACACHRNSSCDVAHVPADCTCMLCGAHERSRVPGEWFPFTDEEKALITAVEEKALGRQLRPDEKTKLFGPPVLLANSLDEEAEDEEIDPTGWWHSEKLDGVRAYWDGKQFITRQGNIYNAPEWFTKGFPNHPLDGELWMGRRMFQTTISVVKSGPSDRWRQVSFMAFDVPHMKCGFEERIAFLQKLILEIKTPWIKYHAHGMILNWDHLIQELRRIEGLGGEGVMIRQPKSLYETRRSSTQLKVKPYKDSEAVVTGYTPGKKQFKGLVGGLQVRTPDGREFCVGSGLKASDRKSPPAIGATITYRYTDTTNAGLPKCASFACVRDYED